MKKLSPAIGQCVMWRTIYLFTNCTKSFIVREIYKYSQRKFILILSWKDEIKVKVIITLNSILIF